MAIYHLNIRHCSRDKGQSSQAKFDYINRIDKYSKKLEDLQYSQSGNLPSFAQNNPELFWQSADKFERANARICTEIEFALPRELTLEQQTELVQSFIRKTIDNEQRKLPFSFAIHNDKANNNPHCHLVFSVRQLDGIERTAEQFFKRANSKNAELGGAKKDRDVIQKDFLKNVRKMWSEQANFALEKYGHTARIDERSYQEQGVKKEPRARLDRVTWQELKRLEENAEFYGEVIERKQHQIEQEKAEIAQNTPKNVLEPLAQKDDVKHEQIKKIAGNRKGGLSQDEFDKFLIDNWLEPNKNFINGCEKRAKMRSEWEQYGKDLEKINADYKALNEQKQGFLGLWETKEQKQAKQDLENEYNRIKALRKEKADEHNAYNDNLNEYEKNVIDPLRKKIDEMKANNPHLIQRNHQQLIAIKFQGAEQWAKEKLEREQSQKRQISHGKENVFSL